MSPSREKGQNDRGKKRIPMRVSLEFQVLEINSPHTFRRQDKKEQGYVVNLSDTGLQLSTDQIFRPDAEFKARLEFPTQHPPIEAQLSVKWARKNSFKNFGAYAYGIHLDQIDDEARDLLLRIYD